MIIPIKCFTCGNVIADKYNYYLRETKKRKIEEKADKVTYLTPDNVKKTIEGEILDELNLKKYCCRRHLLTHVDIE
jgi:DNA-directed RNA polymerase subunit N (RpoN/RPB10)